MAAQQIVVTVTAGTPVVLVVQGMTVGSIVASPGGGGTATATPTFDSIKKAKDDTALFEAASLNGVATATSAQLSGTYSAIKLEAATADAEFVVNSDSSMRV